MVSRSRVSQNPPHPSKPRNTSTDGAGHQDHPDEGGWEDIEEVCRPHSPTSNSSRLRIRRTRAEFAISQPSSTRKRHQQHSQLTKSHYAEHPEGVPDAEKIASPPPPPLSVEPVTQQQPTELAAKQEPADLVIQQQLAEHARKQAIAIFKYTVKVVADAFHLYRRFFSCALGILILWFLLSMMTSQLVFFTRPICSLPIVSPMIPFCRWEVFREPPARPSDGQLIHWADYPRLVDMQTRTFDQLLDESVGNKGLALEVKKAEMASNDLINLVRVSDLKSRDQVVERLGRFVSDARGTGRSLHSLGAKIHGAVDSITSLNDYALQTIKASKAPSFAVRVLPFVFSTSVSNKEAVLETFLMSMGNIASHTARLREEAEICMGHLLRLEEHLMVLHEITHRDNEDLTAAKEDVLAELWTWLGGNKRKLRRMELSLGLLGNVNKYRREALVHVVATLQTLHTLDVDLEELRTRVAMPDAAGDKIPIDVHIRSIKAGVERLKEGQVRASLKHEKSIAKILEVGA